MKRKTRCSQWPTPSMCADAEWRHWQATPRSYPIKALARMTMLAKACWNTYLASPISSPESASVNLVASAPNFLTASLRVKKFPVLLLIFFPFNIK